MWRFGTRVRTVGPSSRPFMQKTDDLPKSVLSSLHGVPEELLENRKAIITQVGRSSIQSGRFNASSWRIHFEREPHYKTNLMGWSGSEDPLHYLHMDFPSKEAAIQYAKQNGWDVNFDSSVNEHEDDISFVPKNYGDNFKYKPPK